MKLKIGMWLAALALAGCSSSDPPDPEVADKPPQETVLDPLVGTLDRARGVQQTIDDGAAELRRRIEEEEQ